MERYTRVLSLDQKLIEKDCPVVFNKGALLKDNKTNTNILQLQFQNIGIKKLKALFLSINCFDLENNLLQEVKYNYLDLTAAFGETFGENVPILLENNYARNFELLIAKIIFEDNSIYESHEKMIPLKGHRDISDLGELKEEFIREVHIDAPYLNCKARPSEFNGLWYCACGTLNFSGNIQCGACKYKKEKLFRYLDIGQLSKNKVLYLEEEARKEEEKKIQAQEEIIRKEKQKKKTLKIAGVSITFLLICVFASLITIYFVIPQRKYSAALAAIDSGDYQTGYQILEDLGNYKDSQDQIKLGKYKEAVELIEREQYIDGCNILEDLGEYKDVEDQMMKGKYGWADQLMDAGEYQAAAEILENILDYDNAQERYMDCIYAMADQFYLNGEYDNAIIYYEKIPEYKDSGEKLLWVKYDYVKNCYSTMETYSACLTVQKYLEELKETGYMDAEKLYNKVFPKVILAVNYDSEITDSDLQELKVDDEKDAYIHVYSFGGSLKGYTMAIVTDAWQYSQELGNKTSAWRIVNKAALAYDSMNVACAVYDPNGNRVASKFVVISK